MKKKKEKIEQTIQDKNRIVYWDPTTGCTKLSVGCRNCYAEVIAEKLQKEGDPKFINGFNPTQHEDSLWEPYYYENGMLVSVSPMSDLFHPKISKDFIKKVFKSMNENLQHHFTIVTKYVDRLAKISKELNWTENIMIGVSVENEGSLGRIELLRNTRAFKKMVLFEPLMGPINSANLKDIDYVVIGGEIGKRNSRALKPEWLFKLISICEEQNVTYSFKGWGSSAEAKMYKDL
jgi:protein gp37